jgi:GT2 family glycosyltransferase
VKPTLIVVIDNASHDGSPDLIAEAYPQVVVLRNQKNEGFANANNQAIAYLLAQGVDFVWILNNDTIVAHRCLEALIETAEIHPGAGYSAKIYYETPCDLIWYAGAFRHPLHCAPVHETSSNLDFLATDGAMPVDFVSGCCMFVPAHVLRTYGAFVASYVAYSEDSDWCWRIRTAGLQLYYVPNAVLWHRLSASLRKNTSDGQTDEITPFAAHLMVRNHLWTVRRHVKQRHKRWFHLSINVGIQVRNVLFAMFRRKWRLTLATSRGLLDGLLQIPPADIPDWGRHWLERIQTIDGFSDSQGSLAMIQSIADGELDESGNQQSQAR